MRMPPTPTSTLGPHTSTPTSGYMPPLPPSASAAGIAISGLGERAERQRDRP